MRIRKRELYPENDVYVDRVISDMVKLPILHVGKSTKLCLLFYKVNHHRKIYCVGPRIYLTILLQCIAMQPFILKGEEHGKENLCMTKFPYQPTR